MYDVMNNIIMSAVLERTECNVMTMTHWPWSGSGLIQTAKTYSIKQCVFFSFNLAFWWYITPTQLHTSGKCCPCFHVFPLLICISVYGREHDNYKQQTIHLWRKMDSVANLGNVSLNNNRRSLLLDWWL